MSAFFQRSHLCLQHRWPRQSTAASIDSSGTVAYERCNECTAVKITFTVHLLDGSSMTESKVLEPSFLQDELRK